VRHNFATRAPKLRGRLNEDHLKSTKRVILITCSGDLFLKQEPKPHTWRVAPTGVKTVATINPP
jgi:hypothetical protein